ncbi:protein SYM1-like isoform X1 [Nymphaea colorata]|nr:protein SYM1-like isoform X1 [Nymphaea colorata]
MLVRLWKWYQRCLTQYPLTTQVVSSGILWGVGDVSAQSVTHFSKKSHRLDHQEAEDLKISWKRVAFTSLFGFTFVGPVGNYWYEGLDRFIKHRLRFMPNTVGFVTAKVAADGLLFGPLDLLTFFTYMGFSSGKSFEQVKDDVKRDFLPAFILEGAVWPLAQAANFRYIPVRYQLLYVNVFCLLDSAFLSWVEQQEDAPWKQWITSLVTLKEEEGQR